MSTWLAEHKSTATRRSRYTTIPFQEVVNRLLTSIGQHRWRPSDEALINPEFCKQEIKDRLGPHGFMIFELINHGNNLRNLNVSPGQGRSVRVSLGNPLVAARIVQIDPAAALHVPLTLLVREVSLQSEVYPGIDKERTGSVVSYNRPMSLLVPQGKEKELGEVRYQELLAAAIDLDKMLEALIEFICSPINELKARM